MSESLSRSVRWLVGLAFLCCAVTGSGQTAEEHLAEALQLYHAGQYEKALEACDHALRQDPGMSEAYRRKGYAHWKLGNPRNAIVELDRALDADPQNAKAWIGKFNIYYHVREDYQAAEQACSRAIALDPGYVNAYINRAAARLALKKPAAAIEDCKSALELDPDNLMALNSRGLARRRTGDLRGALDDLDRVLHEAPQHTSARFNRALTREALGDLDGAIADLSALLERHPEDHEALAFRGQFLTRQGQLAPARRDLTAALRLQPGDPRATRVLREVEELERQRATAAISTQGAVDSGGAAAPPPSQLPTLTFRADEDPCQVAATAPERDVPWAKAALSDSASAPSNGTTPLGTFADFEALSAARYAGAVSAVKGAMRTLYGPMSPADERAFENLWAPLHDHPSQKVIDYLNQLSPLLARFLTDRDAVLRASSSAQAALMDCALAVAAESPSGWFDAISAVDQNEQLLRVLLARMERTAQQIEALGNPPNPLAEKCAARQRYRRAFPKLPGSPLDGVWTDGSGDELSIRSLMGSGDGRWLLYRVSRSAVERYQALEARGYNISEPGMAESSADEDAELVAVPGISDMLAVAEVQADGQVLVWYPTSFFMILEAWEPVAEDVMDRTESKESYMQSSTTVTTTRHWRDPTARLLEFPYHTRSKLEQAAQSSGPSMLAKFTRYRSGNAGEIEALLEGRSESSPRPAPPSRPAQPAVTATHDTDESDGREDAITFHRSMIEVLEGNLQREERELATTTDPARRQQLRWRILHIRSDIQAERDLIASYKTGTVVHTRTAFDDYAQQQFIARLKTEAERIDRTRTIVAGIERQIQLLPEDQRDGMRRKARELLDAEMIAKGDIERARRLAQAINEQLQGYWEGQAAIAEEEAIRQEENEFWAHSGVMAAGSVVVGLGTAGCAQTFGETAAITQWAPRLIGGVYGGATGVISGGPVEGVQQSISMASPVVGSTAVMFLQGWRQGLEQQGATWKDGLWHGAQNAGIGYFMGKGFELSSSMVTRGALRYFGRGSRLFKPLLWQRPTVQQQFDAARMRQDIDDAMLLIGRFRDTEVRFIQAQSQHPAGSPQLAQLRDELNSLAASLNSSYHCKWLIKYKGSPLVRSAFKRTVQATYDRTMPEFYKRLRARGYNVDDLAFAPLRNHSSAGSTSMDLDLALQETRVRTVRTPNGLRRITEPATITRNGKKVDLLTFQRDAQQALNESYHSVTKLSALRSEVNLTTSVHEEAFSTPELLRHDVDFAKVEDLSSIGRVLDFKVSKIGSDPSLSSIAKTQASCRETSKEMENMLLKKLRQDLGRAPQGSTQARQLQQDITYWEGMLQRFQQIGRSETDPYRILELERQIRVSSGGKGTHEVIADLSRYFTGQ